MDGFTPTTITDQPIPLLGGGWSQPLGSNSNPLTDSGAASPTPIKEVDIEPPVFAQDVISSSLNSETKSILGEFKFEQLGAIKIGEYVNGVSGEIAISPNGIVAKNLNGVDTFTIDGVTGDATFAGTVSAATFESNNILTGLIDVGVAGGNAYVRLDGANNRIIINDGTNDRILIGYQAGGF